MHLHLWAEGEGETLQFVLTFRVQVEDGRIGLALHWAAAGTLPCRAPKPRAWYSSTGGVWDVGLSV